MRDYQLIIAYSCIGVSAVVGLGAWHKKDDRIGLAAGGVAAVGLIAVIIMGLAHPGNENRENLPENGENVDGDGDDDGDSAVEEGCSFQFTTSSMSDVWMSGCNMIEILLDGAHLWTLRIGELINSGGTKTVSVSTVCNRTGVFCRPDITMTCIVSDSDSDSDDHMLAGCT